MDEIQCKPGGVCVKLNNASGGAEQCGTAEDKCTTTAEADYAKILCPDGLNCAKDLQECAKTGTWNGCPPRKVPCPGARLECVDYMAQCIASIGCKNGTIQCGMKRGKSGEALGPMCMTKDNCAEKRKKYPDPLDMNTKPVDKVHPLNSSNVDEQSIPIMAANGMEILKMTIKKGALQRKPGNNSTKPMSFSVASVPDSELTNGPFKKIWKKLLSPVFDIRPDSPVDGSMEMNFPILDEAAEEDNETCTNLLKRSTVVSYSSNSTSNFATQEDKPCEQGEIVGTFSCVCKMSISHFTMFAVGPFDASKATTDAPADAPATPNDDKGLDAGIIVGIVVGVLAVGAVLTVLLVVRRRQQSASAPRQPRGGPPDLDL